MVTIAHKNGDDWGMVQMALFYPTVGKLVELTRRTGFILDIGLLKIVVWGDKPT